MGRFRLPRVLFPRHGLHRRMAGACGRLACAARPAGSPGNSRRNTPSVSRGMLLRWHRLALVLACLFVGAAQAQVLSARIWPARDYTRLTIESKEEIKYSIFSVKDPQRLVLDLEVADIPPGLADLHTKVADDDPYIQGLRTARNRPGVVRLVLDLKTDVKPQAFTLRPIAEYGYPLVP